MKFKIKKTTNDLKIRFLIETIRIIEIRNAYNMISDRSLFYLNRVSLSNFLIESDLYPFNLKISRQRTSSFNSKNYKNIKKGLLIVEILFANTTKNNMKLFFEFLKIKNYFFKLKKPFLQIQKITLNLINKDKKSFFEKINKNVVKSLKKINTTRSHVSKTFRVQKIDLFNVNYEKTQNLNNKSNTKIKRCDFESPRLSCKSSNFFANNLYNKLINEKIQKLKFSIKDASSKKTVKNLCFIKTNTSCQSPKISNDKFKNGFNKLLKIFGIKFCKEISRFFYFCLIPNIKKNYSAKILKAHVVNIQKSYSEKKNKLIKSSYSSKHADINIDYMTNKKQKNSLFSLLNSSILEDKIY